MIDAPVLFSIYIGLADYIYYASSTEDLVKSIKNIGHHVNTVAVEP
jgi:hypothetical protein